MAAKMDPAELTVMVNNMKISRRAFIHTRPVKEDISRQSGLLIKLEVTLLKTPPPEPPAPPELWGAAACTPKANPLLVTI
eukprot:560951-Prorocentrum_minimum.AAC.2